MSHIYRLSFALASLLAISAPALAQSMNGTLDSSFYGAPLAVQNTQTQFGDSNLGQVGFANGSELDATYAQVENHTLHLFFAGNLESNFNKLEIFLDTTAGGQNTLRGDNPDVDFNGLNRLAGLDLPTGFFADHYMTVTGGDSGGYTMFGNYAQLLTSGGGTGMYLGSNGAASTNPLTGGTNPLGIHYTINNSNTAGVTGGTGLDLSASGASVLTGVELTIPLAALGNPTGSIGIFAFINGSGHDFVSNQALGGIGGGGNFGEPSSLNFANTGASAAVLVPEPGTFALIGFAIPALGLALARRKKA